MAQESSHEYIQVDRNIGAAPVARYVDIPEMMNDMIIVNTKGTAIAFARAGSFFIADYLLFRRALC